MKICTFQGAQKQFGKDFEHWPEDLTLEGQLSLIKNLGLGKTYVGSPTKAFGGGKKKRR